MTLRRLQFFMGSALAAAFLGMGIFQLDGYSDPRGTNEQLISGLLCMIVAPVVAYVTLNITDGLKEKSADQAKSLENEQQ